MRSQFQQFLSPLLAQLHHSLDLRLIRALHHYLEAILAPPSPLAD